MHILSYAGWKPLTELKDYDGRDMSFTPDLMICCHECRDTRPASEMVGRSGYDYFHAKCGDECYTGARRERLAKGVE